MSPLALHLVSLSAKIAVLGGLAWILLYLLRRAPAASRSRLCSLALMAIMLFAAGEIVSTPKWVAKRAVFHVTSAASPSAPVIAAGKSIDSWIAILWMIGAGVMLIRAITGRIALAILLRRSTLSLEVCGLDVRIGEIETPVLAGLLRPAILLPASVLDWNDDQRRMVFTHEITHFRQGDCWSNLLAQLVRAAFWFHPIVWLLVSRMSREQELTCDEAVVASGHSPHDYAAFLLDIVRNLRSRQMFACAMAGSGAQSLKRRFANLFDDRPRPALTRRLAASLALLGAVVIILALVRPALMPQPYRVRNGVTMPAVIRKIDPQYSEEARRKKFSGTVLLQIVINPEGRAERIRVAKGVGYGLDQKAIEAVQNWTFRPGTKDGIAVPVYATVEVNFRLL